MIAADGRAIAVKIRRLRRSGDVGVGSFTCGRDSP